MRSKLPLVIAVLVLPGLALAAQPDAKRPELFEALGRCRTITDDAARLRCFDGAAAALQKAAERKEVIVVDRRQVRETRRRLFGLTLPVLPFLDNGDDTQADAVKSVEGVIASARGGTGSWVFVLRDGAVWAQTDRNVLAIEPRPGQKVEIRRAALGSFMMRVNGQPGIRVKRSS